VDDVATEPETAVEEAIDTGAPADFTQDLDLLGVIEAELEAAQTELDDLEATTLFDPDTPPAP